MCLLKVYLEEGNNRKLITENIALISKEGNTIKLHKLETGDVINLENIDISLIDTLNSIMIIKFKK